MSRESTLEDHLILLKNAPARVKRSRTTIYRWIAEKRVKTVRIGRDKYVFVADLLKAEQETGGQGLR